MRTSSEILTFFCCRAESADLGGTTVPVAAAEDLVAELERAPKRNARDHGQELPAQVEAVGIENIGFRADSGNYG